MGNNKQVDLKRERDDDGDGGYRQSKKPPIFQFYSLSFPDDATASFVFRRLAYARTCRETRARQISATEARLKQAKLEVGMLLEELRESQKDQIKVDMYIGRLNSYIHANRLREPHLSCRAYAGDDGNGNNHVYGYGDNDADANADADFSSLFSYRL